VKIHSLANLAAPLTISGMAEPFLIRDAIPSDEVAIVDFNARLAAETEAKTLDLETLQRGVRAALDDVANGRYFMACRGDESVGQLLLTYEWSDWRNGRIWWIQSAYVLPAHRRQGAFTALYEHVRRRAAETPGVVGLRLYVERHNAAAQAVYRHLGMRDSGYLVLEDLFDGHD
jgi:ribosomal protein S18 acetylase RimI-like enzyme